MSGAQAPARQEVWNRTLGDGPRPALALHCTIAHSGAWRGVAAALGDGHSLVCPDMLSHGKSPDWDGTGDFQDRLVEAIAPLLDRPMDVIGHSFGALVALRLAVDNPDRVRSLTLIEPVFFAVAAEDAPDVLAEHDLETAPFRAAISEGDFAGAARLFNRMWSRGGPRWPDLPERTRVAMTRGIHVVPACNAPVYQDRPGLLDTGRLAALPMPVLLLRGSRTHPVIAVVNDGLAKRMPGARNKVIEEAGHMLPITHPRAVAAELTALFATRPV